MGIGRCHVLIVKWSLKAHLEAQSPAGGPVLGGSARQSIAGGSRSQGGVSL